jgi:hypothetical protein
MCIRSRLPIEVRIREEESKKDYMKKKAITDQLHLPYILSTSTSVNDRTGIPSWTNDRGSDGTLTEF